MNAHQLYRTIFTNKIKCIAFWGIGGEIMIGASSLIKFSIKFFSPLSRIRTHNYTIIGLWTSSKNCIVFWYVQLSGMGGGETKYYFHINVTGAVSSRHAFCVSSFFPQCQRQSYQPAEIQGDNWVATNLLSKDANSRRTSLFLREKNIKCQLDNFHTISINEVCSISYSILILPLKSM